ncbi:MAG: hypothetical protein LH609_18540 [Rudanella sp.]|nr:hypothetical protein [Rudanella sp.]
MLSSCSIVRASVMLASVAIGLCTTSCRMSNQAFIQYQRPNHAHKWPAEALPVALSDTLTPPLSGQHSSSSPDSALITSQVASALEPRPTSTHSRNPEAREPRPKKWLHSINLNNDPAIVDYAPQREQPVLTTKRKVPGIVKGAMVGGILSQGLLVFGTATGALWFLTIILPLASVLIGIAGLAKISRRREEFRGKGWAMSAIMLATGALGLALVAAAALATSEVIWK